MALRYTISNNGLQLLQDFLGLTPHPSISDELRDVIFVAIDFENLGNIKQDPAQNLDSQVGIAILDTRILASSQLEKAILTYSFATGSPRYCTATTKNFLFGKTTTIRQQDILTTLESLVPRTRNIALIGHDLKHDLHVLQILKFDLQTSIVGILDTQKIASELLPDNSSTLRDILQALQCPFDKLHTAGNDAQFTLRALLLLAEKSCTHSIISTRNQDTLASIQAIAQVPVLEQLSSDPQNKGRQKKIKRQQRSRKHQSKSWDTETQECIRAERAARREILDN
jgi:hypothetical protein